jgi:hypothetical protein
MALYTSFGITKDVPLVVYCNNKIIESDTWDHDLWIEVGEDWYSLMSSNLKNKRVRIIERNVWLRCKELNR